MPNWTGVVVVAVVVVLVVNIFFLQSSVIEQSGYSEEEEKLLMKIQALRDELRRVESAEKLLEVDARNFAHSDVLNALHIEGEERAEAAEAALEDAEKTQGDLLEKEAENIKSPDLSPDHNFDKDKHAENGRHEEESKENKEFSAPGSKSHDFIDSLPKKKFEHDSRNNVLIVGGTDGSGTRRVVQLLTKLGVKVVSEDPETYDIHADLFGGWPNVVTPVLKSSGSIVASPKEYPTLLINEVSNSLRRLIQKAAADSRKPQSYKLAVGGTLARPPDTNAARVSFAFKAPVAMTLVPWWQEVTDNLMFLHVVRDGRDIAFSANQGPVNKFFSPMFEKKLSQRSTDVPTGSIATKAIKLWADWNNGLRQYAESVLESQALSKEKHFDYLQVHIEDLVDSSQTIRLDAISKMAKFVGSDLDDDSLCCLAVEGSLFMGSHDRSGKIGSSGESQLKKKYGKWREKFKADLKLERSLMKWAKGALEDLGYLNMDDIREMKKREFINRMSGKYQCELTRLQCIAKSKGVTDWRKGIAGFQPSSDAGSTCQFRSGVDFRGGKGSTVDISSMALETPDECCIHCSKMRDCKYFTFAQNEKRCYFKRSSGSEVMDDTTFDLVSGSLK